jgi:pantoate kinase
MISAFCPGHITCFFRPVRSANPLSAGSVGAGIRISLGSTVTLERRADSEIKTSVDGEPFDAKIIEDTIRYLEPAGGYDVEVRRDLPGSQGFGMSAADAVASALCICALSGKSEEEGYRAAHVADMKNGGGRGDVAGIMSHCRQPTRTEAGIPPFGKTVDFGVGLDRISLAVLGNPTVTGTVLSDREKSIRIRNAGSEAVKRYIGNPSEESLYGISNVFSAEAEVRTPEVKYALEKLREEGLNGAMCMLGNSIFSSASEEVLRQLLPDAYVVSCRATSEQAKIIRRE